MATEFQAVVLVQGETHEVAEDGDLTLLTPYLAYEQSGDRILSGIRIETMEGSVYMAIACDPIQGWRNLNHIEGIQESDSDSDLFKELVFLGQLACLESEEAMEGVLELVGNDLYADGDGSYPSEGDILAIWDKLPANSAVRIFLWLELYRAISAGDLEFSDQLRSRLDDFDRARGRLFVC